MIKKFHQSLRKGASSLVVVSSLLASLATGQAATYSWDPTQNPSSPAGGDGTWDTSSNFWSNGTTGKAWSDLTGASDTAVFGGSPGAVTLGSTLGAAGLIFNTSGYTLNSGTLNLGSGGIDASALTTGVTTISSPLTLLSGQQYWKVGAGGSLVVNGALTRNAGNAVNFTTGINLNGSGLANNNGILGGWATMGNAGTAGSTGDWASLDGSGNVVAYTGYTNIAGAFVNNNATNYNITGNSTAGTLTVNSVRMGADLTINASSTLYLNSGGLMLNGISRWLKANNATTSKLTANGGTLYIDSTGSGGTGDDNWQIQTVIVDNGSPLIINKNGPGMVALTNVNNSFTGNIVINSGRLETATGLNGGNEGAHINTALGDVGNGQSRTITVNSGGTLALTGANVFGWSSGALSTVNLVVNKGGVFRAGAAGTGAGFWNKMGPMTLNGGSVLLGNGNSAARYGALSLLGTVTVSGASASTIGFLPGATGGNNWLSLGLSNVASTALINFNVADVTGDSGADLTVSPSMTDGASNGGAGSITKSGAGTMVLTGTSTYTGSTTISAGVLQLGNGGTTGALSTSSAITDNGTFTINRSNAVAQGTDFSGSAIAGSGGFTQAGSGVTTLSAANSYSGPTNVNAGTLTVNGAHSGSGSVTVASGATLNGTGSLAGNVVVNGTLSGGLTLNGDATINMGAAAAATFNGSIANFGSISSAVTVASGKALTGSGSFGSDLTVNGSMTPGASGIGSDTITGNLGFGTSAQLSIVLGRTTAGAQPVGGTDYGQVTVGGNVSLDGTLALTIGTGIQEGDVFYLIVNNGINSLATAFSGITVNGSLISGNEFTYNGQSYAVSYTADASAGAAGFSSTTGNDLAVAAVPEPGTWAMIVGGLGMLVSFQRRKRSSH